MINKEVYGHLLSGDTVYQYHLSNKNGLTVSVINYDAIITRIITPDKNRTPEDIVLGFDTLDKYLENPPYFGAVIGRSTNRTGNGQVKIKGKTVRLSLNRDGFHQHGGFSGFDKKLWKTEDVSDGESPSVTFSLFSPDGDEGYPGNLKVTVKYSLTNDNRFVLEYSAETDKTTVVNLTNHSYFNLKGEGKGDVYGHIVQCISKEYTLLDAETLIPTGETAPVTATPYDFTKPVAIGERIREIPPGYDINFVLPDDNSLTQRMMRIYEPESGRVLDVFTNQPGIQFYTGNYLEGIKGKNGHQYDNHHAFCVETQGYPDAPNHPEFRSTLLEPGEKYYHKTIFAFGMEKTVSAAFLL